MANPRITLDGHIGLKHREHTFTGIVRSRLLSLGYTIAEPVPDTGEDLWFTKKTSENNGVSAPPILRAQLKAFSSYEIRKTKPFRIYSQNVTEDLFEYAIRASHFVFFFGIRHEDGPHLGYHIGCLPTCMFLDPWETGRIRKGTKKKKRTANLYLHCFDDGHIEFYGRGFQPDLTQYFADLSKGIEESKITK